MTFSELVGVLPYLFAARELVTTFHVVQCEQSVVFVAHVAHSKRRARAVTCSSKHHVHHDSGHIYLFPPLCSCPVLISGVVALCNHSFLLVKVGGDPLLFSELLPGVLGQVCHHVPC